MSTDPGFVTDFVGKVGAPIFSASLVGCLLSARFELIHGVLIGLGLGMMAFCHWRNHHRTPGSPAT